MKYITKINVTSSFQPFFMRLLENLKVHIVGQILFLLDGFGLDAR